MKKMTNRILCTALLLMTIILQSCIAGTQLRTTSADRALIAGTYTLLLYGCRYPEQIDNVAILVDENSRYPVEIYDLDTSFNVKKNVPARQAVAEADVFARCSFHRTWEAQVSKIVDDRDGDHWV